MARGFGSTLGVSATTDGIESAYTATLVQRTIALWIQPRVTNTGFNAISDKILNAADTDVEDLYWGASGTTVNLDFFFTTGPGHWTIATVPGNGVWTHLTYSYDSSATANNPVFYVNGSSVTVTRVLGPIGVAKTNTSPYRIGGWASDAGANSFDGMLAEYGIWSVLLTQAEITALGEAYAPSMIRPTSLVEYIPMLRDNISLRLAAPTLTGTQVQTHPRIYYPRKSSSPATHTAGSTYLVTPCKRTFVNDVFV